MRSFFTLLLVLLSIPSPAEETAKKDVPSSAHCLLRSSKFAYNPILKEKAVAGHLFYNETDDSYKNEDCENGRCYSSAVVPFGDFMIQVVRVETPDVDWSKPVNFFFSAQFYDKNQTKDFAAGSETWSLGGYERYKIPTVNFTVRVKDDIVLVQCTNRLKTDIKNYSVQYL